MKTIGHYINGQRYMSRSTQTSPVFNPATGKQSATLSLATREETQHAIACAKEAFPAWSAMSPLRRARVLFAYNQLLLEHNDALVAAISQEHGKVWDDAQGELTRGREVVEFACGIPHLLKGEYSYNAGRNVDAYTLMQPLGVCAGITPFNFPAMVPMWMFPIALACGNTFVLKPSEKDPSAALLLAELLSKAGLPDGAFNVVNGDKTAVDTILQSPDVAAVSFVGSTPIAEYVCQQAATNHKRVQALGGAKNHMVIMPDADIPNAVQQIIGAAFGSAGERCMAISVAVVVGDIADEFLAQLKKKTASLKVGAGYSKGNDCDFGPVISAQHKDKVLSYVDTGIREGASLVVDGRTCTPDNDGFFVGACVFDNVKPHMRIYKEEIFGPVLCVVRVPTASDALELVNAHEYGNGAAIFTTNGAVAREFASQCRIGMIGINVPIPVPMAFHSFGGWKRSLFGSHDIHGVDGVRFYTHSKKITSRWQTQADSQNPFHMPTLG